MSISDFTKRLETMNNIRIRFIKPFKTSKKKRVYPKILKKKQIKPKVVSKKDKPIVYSFSINLPKPVKCPPKLNIKPKTVIGNQAQRDFCHLIIEVAILYGLLVRRPCEVCGNTKSHAHHTSYFRPLDVQWLCYKHHWAAHHRVSLKNIPGAY